MIRAAQRRCWRDNTDIESRLVRAKATGEQYNLFRYYIDSRHSDGGMADMSMVDYQMMVEDSHVDTRLIEYRLPAEAPGGDADRLIACCLTDRLADGLSMASVRLTWATPLNTDGSTIVDGDHYEVRYRPVSTSVNPLVPAGPVVPIGPGPYVATRSRLPWALGMFDNGLTTAKFDAFQSMTGGLIDFVDQHPAWGDITGSWWWSPHQGRGYDVMVSVPMYDGSISTNNAAMWTTAAQNMVTAGWTRTFWRLGVEFNLANSWQANNSNYMTWCTRFNEAAAAIKAVQPGARIVLCPNEGNGAGVLSQANTLYIINNTNWDVLAPDYYDQWEPIYNSGQAAFRFGTADTFGTMNYYLGIVRTKARKLGLGEWGVASGTQWAGHQGGDNPYYINYLMDWLATNRDVVEMVAYFEEPDPYLRSDITTTAINPNARAAFQAKVTAYRA